MRAPAPTFSSARARQWILAAALVTGLTYMFRRLVEPATPATVKTGPAALLGAGAPPPVEQWAVSYAVAFLGLALLALASPEVAAGLAVTMVAATLLTNGQSLVTDLNQLQGRPAFNEPNPKPAAGPPAPTPAVSGTPFGGFRP